MTDAEKALKDAAEEIFGIASQDMPVGSDEVLEAMKAFEEAYAVPARRGAGDLEYVGRKQ